MRRRADRAHIPDARGGGRAVHGRTSFQDRPAADEAQPEIKPRMMRAWLSNTGPYSLSLGQITI